jgi:hypothetical protein
LAAVARQEAGKQMMTPGKFKRIIKHIWLDASDTKRAVPPDVFTRLTRRVAASESLHTGQIRICVEASLPTSYLWRLGSTVSITQLIRQRAVMLFGKLRVWDTEHNNGVLIYLQLAERAIEIVADRGLSRHVPQQEWQAMTLRMSAAFSSGRFEDGLTQALEEVSALLLAHFPATVQPAGEQQNDNLPDEPVLQ